MGDRVLVQLDGTTGPPHTGRILARMQPRSETFVGLVVRRPSGDLAVEEARWKSSVQHHIASACRVTEGEMIRCARPENTKPVTKVLERFGSANDPRSVPAIVAAKYQLPTQFDVDADEEAAASGPPSAEGREDLTSLPFMTVDGEDARDFDDAVAAVRKPGGGFSVFVAIADVAAYVPAGGALDRAARLRGNSVYLPGQVFPMLPASLANGWCSLLPLEVRAAVVAELDVNSGGELTQWQFRRALISSRCRVTYRELEGVFRDEAAIPGIDRRHVEDLYGAFQLLQTARTRRGALELNTVDSRITLDPATGRVTAIAPEAQLDSHRLIEEFMILANGAVASHLTQHKIPFLYRVHDSPRDGKVRSLRDDLRAAGGVPSGFGRTVTTRRLNDILARSRGRPDEEFIHLSVLRAQAQAEYSPDNIGHFGLGLGQYTHFTSPIRRYCDLSVHRALLTALGFESAPHPDYDILASMGRELSRSERRAAAAEREACQRYAAFHLARTNQPVMHGRIVSVARFGAFVRLDKNGIEGLLPIASLGPEPFQFNARMQQIQSRHTSETLRPGQRISVQLAEADAVRGRVAFRRVGGVEPA